MKVYYTPNEVAQLIGASKQAIRNYTGIYARYLSTEATPKRGGVRRFTEADVKLLAYVYTRTNLENLTHENILELLLQGDLEQFEFQLPPPEEKELQESEEATTALITLERLKATQALLAEVQRRETQTVEELKQREQQLQERLTQREQSFQERINQLERELGEAHGELKSVKARYRRPKWLQWLLGGE